MLSNRAANFRQFAPTSGERSNRSMASAIIAGCHFGGGKNSAIRSCFKWDALSGRSAPLGRTSWGTPAAIAHPGFMATVISKKPYRGHFKRQVEFNLGKPFWPQSNCTRWILKPRISCHDLLQAQGCPRSIDVGS